MSRITNIVIIGAGNVAQHIATSFAGNKTIKLIQVFNHRSSKLAKQFAKQVNCSLVSDYKKIEQQADIYIIAVKDDVIAEVAKNLIPLKLKGLVVHTSGSVEMEVLKNTSKAIGVYYPLQTFSASVKTDWQLTPVLLEANTKAALTKLKYLATSVSKSVRVVNSLKRLQLHLAAVFACNFTNALYVAAFSLVEHSLNKKDTRLLMPVMNSTFLKLQQIDPLQAQTGPAKRNDVLVMKKHLALLKTHKDLATIYKLMSELIVKQQTQN